MRNKIIFGSIIAAAIAGGVYSYFYVKEVKTPVSEAIHAVPLNACFVLESRQAKNTWKKLSETSIMWEDLLGTKVFGRLNRNAAFLDSAILSHPKVAGMIEDRSVFISAHPSTQGEMDFLFLFSLPNVTQQWIVDDFVRDLMKGAAPVSRDYAGTKIYTYPLFGGSFYYAFSKGIFISGFQPALVEDALRQLASGQSLMNNKNFSSLQRSAGEKVEASLYVNYKTLPLFMGQFLAPGPAKGMERLSCFADWTELDISTRPNSALMNGFTSCGDSLGNYLNLFKRQEPQAMEMTKILPSNTATFLFFGISNFGGFRHSYESFLELNHKLFDYRQRLERLKARYRLETDKNLLGWINNEMALVITEPYSGGFTDDCFAVFRSNNIAGAVTSLNQLCDSICKTEKLETDTETFKGYRIRLLELPGILPELLGAPFDRMQTNYFSSIGDYIVFANTRGALHTFISNLENGRTLKNNKYYTSFAENLSSLSSVYLYSNIAGSAAVYEALLNDGYTKDVEAYSDIYHKFEAIGIQFSSGEKMFYTSAFIRHNPAYKQETLSVWEARLDDSVSTQPFLVLNHNTRAKEVAVQDNSNKLYLISNTGKVLWKKQLPEKIMGGIHQVDILKNGKLQLLFNTRSAIYVVDRNGKDYGPFPLKLKSPATSPVSVFDYDKNRDYRLFVACEDLKVYNYNVQGEIISGWKFGKTANPVTMAVQHCSISDKDHIVIIDVSGRISIVDRQGQARVILKEPIAGIKAPFYLDAGKDPGKSYIVACDTLGNIRKVNFRGESQNIRLRDFDSKPFLLYGDLNGDKTKEYILIDNTQADAYSQDKSLVFHYDFRQETAPAGQYLLMSGGKAGIGVVSGAAHELLLINENGILLSGFPLYGNTPFSVGDVNNDGSWYLVTGSDNHIYAYLLQ